MPTRIAHNTMHPWHERVEASLSENEVIVNVQEDVIEGLHVPTLRENAPLESAPKVRACTPLEPARKAREKPWLALPPTT